MKRSIRSVPFLFIASPLLFASVAFAAEPIGSNLHVAGGIALPGTSNSVHANPAGMVGAPTSLVLQAGAPEFWENGMYRAGVQGGGPSFGVAAGIEHHSLPGDDPLIAYYGLAVGTPGFSLGLAARTGLSNADGTTVNAGALFHPGDALRLGITAMGLDDGVNEWGVGLGVNVASGVDFVVDAAMDEDFDNPELKPGIRVGSDAASLTLSYATGPRQQFADGFTAGGSFVLASGTVIEAQYNAGGALSKYYAALTLGF